MATAASPSKAKHGPGDEGSCRPWALLSSAGQIETFKALSWCLTFPERKCPVSGTMYPHEKVIWGTIDFIEKGLSREAFYILQIQALRSTGGKVTTAAVK